MRRKVTQRILECVECGKTPDDGDPMWEMHNGYWCEDCCAKEDDEDEIDPAHICPYCGQDSCDCDML
jgi:hypothetical protein